MTYLEAHGSETGVSVFVPDNLTLHFYAEAGKSARASVTLLVEALGPEQDAPAPVDSVCGKMTDNNSFTGLEPHEFSYSLSIKDPSLNIRYVGSDPELPIGIRLCSRLGQGECAEDQVKAIGRHTCRGVLGVLADAGVIHMMTCRDAGRFNKLQAYPQQQAQFFRDLDKEVTEMVHLTQTNPDEAWSKLNEMYGTLPFLEVKEYWASLDEGGRKKLIESQRRLILMMNENNRIRTFLDTYGARKYLEEAGRVAFYAYHLSSDNATQKLLRAHFSEALTAAEQDVTALHAALKADPSHWHRVNHDVQQQVLIIDGHNPDQPIRTIVAPEEVTPKKAIVWDEVARNCAAALKAALPDENAWFVGIKGGKEILFETIPQETLGQYIERREYDSHWAARPFEFIKDNDDAVECELTVVDVDGSTVTLRVHEPTLKDDVVAAVGHLNATREITVTVVCLPSPESDVS